MAEAASWRARPVFVCSTFRDMQAERDYLQDIVFPELAERLRERRHYLEPIDLRWGVETVSVDEEHEKELLVLTVCLDEVERSQPFFIGLLGDRYGWIPPEERMQAAAQEKGFEGDIAGKSVTALEIEFGVLSSRDQQRRCFFYLRDPLPYDDMPPEQAARYSEAHGDHANAEDAAERLADLKSHLERELPDRVRHYTAEWDADEQEVTGLDAFGQQVLEDLWRELDAETKEFAAQERPSWQEQERQALAGFVEDLTRDFVGREGITDELLAFAGSPNAEEQDWGLCLTGEPGSGKSAVFAQIYRRLQEKNALVLFHAAGVSSRSASADSLLRRWIEELAHHLGHEMPVTDESSADEVEEALANQLRQAARHDRVVLLLDAVNQFEHTPRARFLTWLPDPPPPNVRLIATMVPGEESDVLARRQGVMLRDLPPLDRAEAEGIIRRICERHHRTPHADVVAGLLSKATADGTASWGNPLWLELAVQRLNLLDADDYVRLETEFGGQAEDRLHRLLLDIVSSLPPDVPGLYDWMLERSEELFGEAWARTFASVIALSRNGWRESDLQALLPAITGEDWDGLRFAGLRRSFLGHVVQRGQQGQWDFSHLQLREAVQRRELMDEAYARELHTAVARHLESLTRFDALRSSELVFHYLHADARLRLAFYYIREDLSDVERTNATDTLLAYLAGGPVDRVSDEARWLAGLLEDPRLMEDEVGHLAARYADDLLRTGGRLGVWQHPTNCLALLEAARAHLSRLAEAHPDAKLWNRALGATLQQIGDIALARGELSAALDAYQAWGRAAERLCERYPDSGNDQRSVGVALTKVGDILRLSLDTDAALGAYREAARTMELLAQLNPDEGQCQHDLAACHEKLGTVLMDRGDTGAALDAYRASLDISQRLAKLDTDNVEWARTLWMSYQKMASGLKASGDLTGSLGMLGLATQIMERLAVDNPSELRWQSDLAHSYRMEGEHYHASGDLAACIRAQLRALEIGDRLCDLDSANTLWLRERGITQGAIGDARLAQGDPSAAVVAYEAALDDMARLSELHPDEIIWKRDIMATVDRLGNAHLAAGDPARAKECYERVLHIGRRLRERHPDDPPLARAVSIAHNKLGDNLLAAGDHRGALEQYEASLAICERLAAADTQSLEWQKDLALAHVRMGDLHLAEGRPEAALEAYSSALETVQSLVDTDGRNVQWQHVLSLAHTKVGTALLATHELGEALKAHEASLGIARRLAASDASSAQSRLMVVVALMRLAECCDQRGDEAAARRHLAECRDVLRGMAEAGMHLTAEMAEVLGRLEQELEADGSQD